MQQNAQTAVNKNMIYLYIMKHFTNYLLILVALFFGIVIFIDSLGKLRIFEGMEPTKDAVPDATADTALSEAKNMLQTVKKLDTEFPSTVDFAKEAAAMSANDAKEAAAMSANDAKEAAAMSAIAAKEAKEAVATQTKQKTVVPAATTKPTVSSSNIIAYSKY